MNEGFGHHESVGSPTNEETLLSFYKGFAEDIRETKSQMSKNLAYIAHG